MAASLHPGELAARLIVGLTGTWPTAREEAWLTHWQPAGVILFARNVTGYSQLQDLCEFLHEVLPQGEIVADHEGGPVSQLSRALGRPPVAWSLGVLNDPVLTKAVHQETGQRLRSVGIDRVLAPCADVLTEPRNPVIGARAFGSEAELVTSQVTAAVEGLREGGVLTCLKHWPGHGASGKDSHLTSADGPGIDCAEPFLAGLTAGADAVMVGHLKSAASGLPATLDSESMCAWRSRLEGVTGGPVRLYADDVTMGGLRMAMAERGIHPDDSHSTGMVDPADLPAAWLEYLAAAGSDRLLIRGIPWRALPLAEAQLGVLSAEETETPSTELKIWPAGIYADVLARQQATWAPEFIAKELVLGWLDLTIDDRWEVAGTEDGTQRQSFANHLARCFATVVDLAGQDIAGLDPLQRILVTSHRPLSNSCLTDRLSNLPLAPQGLCLALGHPSLGPDLQQALGSDWGVTPWCDVDWRLVLQGD